MKFEWEDIYWTSEGRAVCTSRAKVLGGWIVSTQIARCGLGVVFVPDQEHKWEIEKD